MASIQIVSDLHLEEAKGSYKSYFIKPRAPYLALLGDIAHIKDYSKYRDFLLSKLRLFKHAFLVLGDIEPWGTTWSESIARLEIFQKSVEAHREELKLEGQFHLLNRSRYDFSAGDSKVTILGCTLFSHIPQEDLEEVSRHTDFHEIREWDVQQHNECHQRDLEFLQTQLRHLKDSGRKVVILTHYSPTRDKRSEDPRHMTSAIKSMHSTDLLNIPELAGFHTWVYGHTHYNCDFEDDKGRRIVTNQRGGGGPGTEGLSAAFERNFMLKL